MFDVSTLAPRDQFEAAVFVSGMCLVAAVVLREWFADREIRIIARVLGLAGWAVVVTFAWRMTETNETLATQLMVKEKQHASPVVSAVASMVFEVATPNGTQISWGGAGPLSVTGRRSLGDYFGDRSGFDNAAREIDATDDLQDAADDANENTSGTARKF